MNMRTISVGKVSKAGYFSIEKLNQNTFSMENMDSGKENKLNSEKVDE